MTYLNDIEEGGETEFYYQKLKVKPRKGLTLIWPVDWTHIHKGHIAPNEEKMIITGWLSFLEQQPSVEEIDKMKKTNEENYKIYSGGEKKKKDDWSGRKEKKIKENKRNERKKTRCRFLTSR